MTKSEITQIVQEHCDKMKYTNLRINNTITLSYIADTNYKDREILTLYIINDKIVDIDIWTSNEIPLKSQLLFQKVER